MRHPGLHWQVAVWHDLGHEGQVLGEDISGSTSRLAGNGSMRQPCGQDDLHL
ncbi:hypothetical protein AB0I81_51495 [Nonomuraea sp. NPDC050404]|uniref:hypothetical protein n=1 Tax=Nonomuraea sp. NPDC050404 TaxID=3155783 RepID=UPI0033D6E77F